MKIRRDASPNASVDASMDTSLQYSEELPRRQVILGGVYAGLIAGTVMGIVAALKSADNGMGIWLHIDSVAATLFGERAYRDGFFMVAVGWIMHLGISATLGAIFSYLFSRQLTSAGSLLGTTILYGIAIWAVMTFVVLPLVNPLMRREMYDAMPGWWFSFHLIFGLGLGLTPVFERVLAGRRIRQQASNLKRAA